MRIIDDDSIFKPIRPYKPLNNSTKNFLQTTENVPVEKLFENSTILKSHALLCDFIIHSKLKKFFHQIRYNQPFLSIEYIISGRIYLRNGTRSFIAEPGDLCLLNPGMDHDLLFSDTEPCEKLGFIIRGPILNSVIQALHLEHTEVIQISSSDHLMQLYDSIKETILMGLNSKALERNSGLTLEMLQMIADISQAPPIPQQLIEIQEFMEAKYANDISVKTLASKCKMSVPQFNRHFINAFKCTPYKYLIHIRMERAHFLLQSHQRSIKEVALAVGYKSPLHFSYEFKQYFGHAPKFDRNQ